MEDVQAFGKRVEQMRTRRRLSIPELVDLTGLTYQSLWRIERGQQGEPGVFTAAKIAHALGCSVDYLVGLYEENTAREAEAAEPGLVAPRSPYGTG